MEKRNVMKLKNFIKDESKTTRLQSIRERRDLSLGGNKVTKKVYTPNLNVTRNKDKAKEFQPKIEKEKKVHEKIAFNKSFDKDRFVQSSGVFSEGGSNSRKSGYRGGERRNNVRDSEPSMGLIIPTISKNDWAEVKKQDDNIMEELLSYDDDFDDTKQPFNPVLWNEKDLEPAIPKIQKTIKTEEPEFKKRTCEESLVLPEDYNDPEKYSDYNPHLTLWSMPDTLAAKGFSDDPNVKQILDCPLHNLLEGKIGKVIVRKSGKTEVYIGPVKYILEATESNVTKEDLVALNVKDNFYNTSGVVIGSLKDRFSLIPNWDSLLS